MSSLKRTIMENNYCHLELFNFREKEQDLVRDEMNPCKITGMFAILTSHITHISNITLKLIIKNLEN